MRLSIRYIPIGGLLFLGFLARPMQSLAFPDIAPLMMRGYGTIQIIGWHVERLKFIDGRYLSVEGGTRNVSGYPLGNLRIEAHLIDSSRNEVGVVASDDFDMDRSGMKRPFQIRSRWISRYSGITKVRLSILSRHTAEEAALYGNGRFRVPVIRLKGQIIRKVDLRRDTDHPKEMPEEWFDY